MPIRKRISDPYSQETADFNHRRKYGRPPRAPRKPTATERKAVYDALKAIPVGKSFSNKEWRERYIIPYITKQFELWGITLALYPTQKRDRFNRDVCTGVYLRMLERDPRTGQFPALRLAPETHAVWYGEVIRWIQDKRYGG